MSASGVAFAHLKLVLWSLMAARIVFSKHLRDSLEVTGFHKKTRPAEHARSLFKLSEALLQDVHEGSSEESAALWDEAQRHLKIREPNAPDGSTDSVYDSMVSIIWR